MEHTDVGLVRRVFREEHGRYTITAMLTRFGDLAVFIYDEDGAVDWQGSNILEARKLIAEQ